MKPMPGQLCPYNASASRGKLSSARYAQGKGMIQDWKSFINNGETASLLPFQMENFYWNIFSQITPRTAEKSDSVISLLLKYRETQV